MITFTPVTIKEVGHKSGGNSHVHEVQQIINSFIVSNHSAIELFYEPGEYANANNFRKSFQNTLIKMNITSIKVSIRGSRVFLYKEY